MDKIYIAEKRNRDKKEIRLKTKKHKKQNKKVEKLQKTVKNIIINYKKTKDYKITKNSTMN